MVDTAGVAPWAYLHFRQLYLEHIQQLEHVEDEPCVIFDQQSQQILQLNEIAQKSGIEYGMPLSQGWLLSEQLHARALQPAVERRLLQEIAGLLYGTFADIAEDVANNGLWLRLSSLTRLLPTATAVTESVARLLPALSYRLTLASNPRTAQLGLADWQQPLAISAGHFPVAKTGLSNETKVKLLHMGLTTLDKLLAIPVPILGKKLGVEIIAFMAELQGQKTLSMHWFQPRSGFAEQVPLSTEAYTWSGLRFICKRLLQSLETFLCQRQLAVAQFQVKLLGRDGQQQQVDVQLAYPQTRTEEFFYLLQVRMESTRLHFAVLYVELHADNFEPLHALSGKLEPSVATMSALPSLVNRLQAKLGVKRVYGLEHTSSWMPELQQTTCPPGRKAGSASHRQALQSWRAPWLIEPEPIEINSWQLQGQPQRLHAPWWKSSVQQRDYILAQDNVGRWGWLCFIEQEKRWYLHGWAS